VSGPGGPPGQPWAAPQGQDRDEPVNPVEVEQSLKRLANDIGGSVRGVSQALAKFREAEREFDQAYARAYMKYDGPGHAKRYAADLDTMGERAARDQAEVVWKYAERRAKAIEQELSAWQTIARSVVAMYGAAGA